jgi:hypothetical protein
MTLTLSCWSNDFERTKEELQLMGNKILKVKKDKESTASMLKFHGGFNCAYITYRHPTLTTRPRKGDLIEYYDWNRGRKTLKKAIVRSTDREYGCLKDHVGIKSTIVEIGAITRIITFQLVPEQLFKYL